MFLVLIEYIDDGDHEWGVCHHGPRGLKETFATLKGAEEYALKRAERAPNKFAVVAINNYYHRPTVPPVIKVQV